jgi:cell division protein FtsI (penicillin-binding protein 3)
MGMRDAIQALQDAGYKYRVTGKGKVVAQSVVAGTALKKGNVIMIRLQ